MKITQDKGGREVAYRILIVDDEPAFAKYGAGDPDPGGL